jgi:glutaminyl-peptide cyclotransferase
MRLVVLAAALAACSCSSVTNGGSGIPVYGYEIVNSYPHDIGAFTEGLFYDKGFLYEATGLNGQSSVRKVKLETGEVVQKHELSENYFGEGIIKWKDKMYQLTWRNQMGFIYDFATLEPKGEFHYPGEGWSMTTDGKRILMDDGTAEIRFWDPETLQETGRLSVTADGEPVKNLNELEWVKGEIFANIWETDRIARIDPKSGKVTGWIDCAGLLPANERTPGSDSVLNGIAYDADRGRLFVTGKNWPKLFEIRVVRKSSAQ